MEAETQPEAEVESPRQDKEKPPQPKPRSSKSRKKPEEETEKADALQNTENKDEDADTESKTGSTCTKDDEGIDVPDIELAERTPRATPSGRIADNFSEEPLNTDKDEEKNNEPDNNQLQIPETVDQETYPSHGQESNNDETNESNDTAESDGRASLLSKSSSGLDFLSVSQQPSRQTSGRSYASDDIMMRTGASDIGSHPFTTSRKPFSGKSTLADRLVDILKACFCAWAFCKV